MTLKVGPNEAATQRELACLPRNLAESALAASAMEMARGLDGPNSFTSKTMGAKTHMDILERLRSLAPPKAQEDGLDEISARRAARLARNAGTSI